MLEVVDGAEVWGEEAFVGSDGVAIGHAGEVVADDSGAVCLGGGGVDFGDGVRGEELEVLSVDGFVEDVSGVEDFPELAEHAGAFVLELFELWGEEDDVVGEFFEDFGFVADGGVDGEAEAVAVGVLGEEVGVFDEGCGLDVASDAFSDEGIDAVVADGGDEITEWSFFGGVDVVR